MTAVVGVDIGTTSAKAASFDSDGTMHGAHEAGYALREPRPGWAVQDPREVVDAVLGVARDAVRDACEPVGVAFSTAMHSLVGVGAGGEPLTDLITWADTRASDQAQRLQAEHPWLHGRTGTPAHPMAPLAKLCWLRECEPETFGRVARWVGVKELVLHRLTGEWAMDHSVASATGMMDLETLDWDPEALELAGVRAEQLPRLVETRAVFADTALGVPIVAGAGDGPLANLGVGAVRPGVAACSIGTSGALRLMVERPTIDPQGRVFCYALTPGRWVVGGAINNGGAVLQWAGDALAPDLGEHPERALLELAATIPAGCEGLVMLPYLLSERAPHWSAVPRGAYVGLSHAHGRGHLVRAAIEGVCQQLALVLASLRDAGNEIRELRATGGFARSALWRQMLADALGMPVGFPDEHEGSAFGAALLGMEALGMIESIDVAADLVRLGDVVEPDAADAAVYARLLPTFAGLYDALGPAFRALGEESRRGG